MSARVVSSQTGANLGGWPSAALIGAARVAGWQTPVRAVCEDTGRWVPASDELLAVPVYVAGTTPAWYAPSAAEPEPRHDRTHESDERGPSRWG